MTRSEESAEARRKAAYRLAGDTPRARRYAAMALMTAQRRLGKEPDQWVIDVAEGRLPA
ncbi:hypothetical protein [Gordonia phthalatica]|uniref:hypothetical protein n=1 Tax=Gordonia phthalatica TaxID=1136941 RepID=UPI000AD25D84|nr:hypothetical protein [Gordonia phthalatica]